MSSALSRAGGGGEVNEKCLFVYLNNLLSVGDAVWEGNEPLAFGALLEEAQYQGLDILQPYLNSWSLLSSA